MAQPLLRVASGWGARLADHLFYSASRSMSRGADAIQNDFTALVYGSLVVCLLEMTEQPADVNGKLDDMGYQIGRRLAHDYARDRSLDTIETPEAVVNSILLHKSRVLPGHSAPTVLWKSPEQCDLKFDRTGFTKNVTIPNLYTGLNYPSMLPGLLRGIFEIFHFRVKTELREEGKAAIVTVSILGAIPIAVPKDDD
jgi:hypothetical protein